jgi:hypothetical protein
MTNGVHTLREPKIDEILKDPIFLAVLKRDGLSVNDIKQVIDSYKETRAARPS